VALASPSPGCRAGGAPEVTPLVLATVTPVCKSLSPIQLWAPCFASSAQMSELGKAGRVQRLEREQAVQVLVQVKL
jgi:hypothetical protein